MTKSAILCLMCASCASPSLPAHVQGTIDTFLERVAWWQAQLERDTQFSEEEIEAWADHFKHLVDHYRAHRGQQGDFNDSMGDLGDPEDLLDCKRLRFYPSRCAKYLLTPVRATLGARTAPQSL